LKKNRSLNRTSKVFASKLQEFHAKFIHDLPRHRAEVMKIKGKYKLDKLYLVSE